MDKETYGKQVSKALEFLNGNYAPVLCELKEKMQEASEEMEFERAIEYRELLNSVSQIAQKQKITNTDGEDKDIIALASDDRDAVVQAVERLSEGIIFMCAWDRKKAREIFW